MRPPQLGRWRASELFNLAEQPSKQKLKQKKPGKSTRVTRKILAPTDNNKERQRIESPDGFLPREIDDKESNEPSQVVEYLSSFYWFFLLGFDGFLLGFIEFH